MSKIVPLQERTPIHLSFDETELPDTLSYSNIIEKVRFIPLETRKEAFIERVLKIAIMGDNYLIASGRPNNPSIKLFSQDGKYQADAVTVGRGPKEFTLISSFAFNDSTGNITVMGTGDGKVVKYDVETAEKTRYRLKEGLDIHHLIALDNGSYMALNSNYPQKKPKEPYPYMFLMNQDFEVINSFFDMTDRYQKNIEGVTEGPALRYQFFGYSGGAIYRDILSDTVFYIDNELKFHPVAIFDFGNKKPSLHETAYDSWDKKQKKVYIRSIEVSDKYLIASYDYKKLLCESIWDLETGKMIYYSENDLLGLNYSFDGFKGRIPFATLNNDKILALLNASECIDMFPEIKDDDNMVLVEITLK